MTDPDGPSSSLLVVDHRRSTSIGWTGETALDRCRAAALDVLARCRRRSAPAGLVTVGDEGITGWEPPAATESRYRSIQHRLEGLRPTAPAEAPAPEPVPEQGAPSRSAIDDRRAVWALRDDESAFATTVRSFLESPDDYHRRIGADQLSAAIRFATRHVPDRLSVVLFADDARPSELQSAVDLARKGGNHVAVYLAPRALFEPRGLADAAEIYREYDEFDGLRRELDGRRRVDVHEVTPT